MRTSSRAPGEEREKIKLPSRATRVSCSARFLICSPKISKKLRLFCRLDVLCPCQAILQESQREVSAYQSTCKMVSSWEVT